MTFPEELATLAAAKMQLVLGTMLMPGGVLSMELISLPDRVNVTVFTGMTDMALGSLDHHDKNLVVALIEKAAGLAVHSAEIVQIDGATGISATLSFMRQPADASDNAEYPLLASDQGSDTVLGDDDMLPGTFGTLH